MRDTPFPVRPLTVADARVALDGVAAAGTTADLEAIQRTVAAHLEHYPGDVLAHRVIGAVDGAMRARRWAAEDAAARAGEDCATGAGRELPSRDTAA